MRRLRGKVEESERIEPARFGVALILITLSIFGVAFSEDQAWIRVFALLAEGAALLFILRMSERGLTLRVARIAVVVAVGSAIVSIAVGSSNSPTLATTVVGALMAFAAPIAIVRRLSREQVVDVQVLAGAMCLYLLIGLFFTFIYKAIDVVNDEPLFVQTNDATMTDITYFSYVTLTTVGYGDFTPAQNGVKMLAVSEALFGQLYLVSAVALVVSQFGRGRAGPLLSPRGERRTGSDDADHAPGSTPEHTPEAPADP
jgi:Ion channel